MENIITISNLSEEEKDATREVLLSSYQQYKNSYKTIEEFNEYMSHIEVSLDNPYIDRVLVAKDNDNQILGTLQIYLNSEDAYGRSEPTIHAPIVRLLGVHPAARGKGIARKLLQESIDYAKQKGSPSLYLHTGEIMKDAIRLYERFGFKRDHSKEFQKNEDVFVRCYRFDID
ncbi:GNAT family N-acetyltransferase [Rummeliibacillus sp. SL167]|uniref:GNAT family N-acetyltransferase n=1 Tax=Rummeliibacillus sp. SL167 TaxID=2579792 RepID=UPI0011B51D8A|nr:GNAT family N-acetyltransferase [Rummeliibacillus sp. SL167]